SLKVVESLSGQLDDAISNATPDSKLQSILSTFKETFGVEKPYIDKDAAAFLPELVSQLVDSPLHSEIAGETIHKADRDLITQGDSFRQKSIDWVSRAQDI